VIVAGVVVARQFAEGKDMVAVYAAVVATAAYYRHRGSK
jgi:hypothetical protein